MKDILWGLHCALRLSKSVEGRGEKKGRSLKAKHGSKSTTIHARAQLPIQA